MLPDSSLPHQPTDEVLASAHVQRGRLRFTAAALTLSRPGGGWLLGTSTLRYVAVRRVRFVLWYLLGGLLTCYCLIGILQNALKPLPGWGGLLVGAGLLTWGLRGAWQLSVHLLDQAEPRHAWLYGADPAQLLRFEEDVNEWLRAQAEARRLTLLAAEEAARAAAGGPTIAVGGVTFTPRPPSPPNPYPPSLLPGILP